MFQEIFLAPFKHTKKFRSPDVALLPFVGGSTHAVMTPLWTPGVRVLLAVWVLPAVCVLLAAATAATVANKTTATATSRLVDDVFTISSSLRVSPGCGWSAPRICLSEARQEVAQVERFTAINSYRRIGRQASAQPSRRSLAILPTGSSHETASVG
jgi:hypothetical protein